MKNKLCVTLSNISLIQNSSIFVYIFLEFQNFFLNLHLCNSCFIFFLVIFCRHLFICLLFHFMLFILCALFKTLYVLVSSTGCSNSGTEEIKDNKINRDLETIIGLMRWMQLIFQKITTSKKDEDTDKFRIIHCSFNNQMHFRKFYASSTFFPIC